MSNFGWVPFTSVFETLREWSPAVTSNLVMAVLWNDAYASTKGKARFQLMLVATPQDRRAPEGADAVPSVACFGGPRRARSIVRDRFDNPSYAAAIAIRSLHGQSGRIGANLEHTQPRVPRLLAPELIGLFHSTTFANLIGILRDGL